MLKPIVFDYFSNLFTSKVQAVDPALLEKILPRVTEEMNIKLRAPFTAEEVKKRLSVLVTSKRRALMEFMRYFISASGMCLV
jgi:hypothetical protein